MKFLFVIESPRNRAFYLTQLQPLGVLYVASFLESKGISTEVIDFNVESKKINAKEYAYIGFSVSVGNIEKTIESIDVVKRENPNSKIIIGGPLVKLIPEKLLNIGGVYCLIEGEAEHTIYDLIKNKDISKIKGVWFKKGDKAVFNGKREVESNLDNLPYPAIEKVPFKKYHVVLKKRHPVMGIITSRGCPYNCIFCDHSLGFKYRVRSAENVIGEIKRDISLGIKELWVADDNFTMDMSRVEAILDIIIKEKLDITFSLPNGVRADRLDENIIQKLKKAGCWMLGISPETGNEVSLKKITYSQNKSS